MSVHTFIFKRDTCHVNRAYGQLETVIFLSASGCLCSCLCIMVCVDMCLYIHGYQQLPRCPHSKAGVAIFPPPSLTLNSLFLFLLKKSFHFGLLIPQSHKSLCPCPQQQPPGSHSSPHISPLFTQRRPLTATEAPSCRDFS